MATLPRGGGGADPRRAEPARSSDHGGPVGEVVGGPGSDPTRSEDPARSPRAALEFGLDRGWRLLWLVADGTGGKIPPRNCDPCREAVRAAGRAGHDPADCPCLTCHAFWAATGDLGRLRAAWRHLVGLGRTPAPAVRTGAVGRLLVLDAEAAARPGEESGLEVLDRWEEFTAGAAGAPPRTLTARTVSGGLHLYLRTPPGWEVRSGRVLPGVDVKSGGGYVGFPGWDGRRSWVDPAAPWADAPAELLAWLGAGRRRGHTRTGRRPGEGGAARPDDDYDFRTFERSGCPDGHRDRFVNDLLFRARVRGAGPAELRELARYHWGRLAQPPAARYVMPWDHVAYKVARVLDEVRPARPTPDLRRWVATLVGGAGAGAGPDPGAAPGAVGTGGADVAVEVAGRVALVARRPRGEAR